MRALQIYTLGHSNHSMERFLELLRLHGIVAVADVRRWPSSKFSSHYNKKELEVCLPAEGMDYHFLGKELGGKRKDEAAITGNSMDYNKIRELPDFQKGINRLIKICENKRTVLMCGEGNPHRCHRHHLIAQELLSRRIEVWHIIPDGSLLAAEAERQEIQLPLFERNG